GRARGALRGRARPRDARRGRRGWGVHSTLRGGGGGVGSARGHGLEGARRGGARTGSGRAVGAGGGGVGWVVSCVASPTRVGLGVGVGVGVGVGSNSTPSTPATVLC